MIVILRDWEKMHKIGLVYCENLNQLIKADSDINETWYQEKCNKPSGEFS